jgi:protein involved in polysaccharide export with SLBB domain/tetratricopeptide (TPR) repeat protein
MKKVLSAGVMLLASVSLLATARAQQAEAQSPSPQTSSEVVVKEAKPKSARKPGATKKTSRTNASNPASEKKASSAQSALKASPAGARDAASYYEIGMGHYESKRFKDAVEAFQQSIRLGSTDPKTYFNLGQAYFSLNRYKEARESYKRAVKVKPDWDEAHYRLGWMYHILNDRDSALEQYKILQTLNPEMAANFQKLLDNDGKAATATNAPGNTANTNAANTEPASTSSPANDKNSAQAAVAETVASDKNQAASSPVEASSTNVAATAATETAAKQDDAAGETKPAATNGNTPTGTVATAANSNGTSVSGTSATSASAPAKDETTAAASEAAAAASASEMPPTSVYRVGVGDVLDIRLLNAPTSRSSLFTVMSGGLIEYPLVGGSFTVAGLTIDEIGARLTAELKRRGLSVDSQVVVGVRDYTSHSVIVSGLVNYPGKKILQREAMPLYVIMAEAQLRPDAGRAVVMRTGESIPINDLTDPASLNVLVRNGDVINISARQLQYYFIGGRINSPGQKAFQPGLTLIQSILAAGGLSRSQETVEISREEADGRLTTTKYALKEIKSGKIPDPRLQPGDRIQVGQ